MAAEEMVRLHATIEGYVQGVSFRYFVTKVAINLGVTGWVRNRYDGSVEVLAEGTRSSLDKLLAELRKGPPSALVTGLEHEWQTATREFPDFNIRPTA
jgi:acylphosphatase